MLARVEILSGLVDLPAQCPFLFRRQLPLFAGVLLRGAVFVLCAIAAAVGGTMFATAAAFLFLFRLPRIALAAFIKCKSLHLVSAYHIQPVATINAVLGKRSCRANNQRERKDDGCESHIELNIALRHPAVDRKPV